MRRLPIADEIRTTPMIHWQPFEQQADNSPTREDRESAGTRSAHFEKPIDVIMIALFSIGLVVGTAKVANDTHNMTRSQSSNQRVILDRY
jgi:hypothetical protein